jgi:hypothetical protein
MRPPIKNKKQLIEEQLLSHKLQTEQDMRNFKFWIVKAIVLTLITCFVFVILTLCYSVVFHSTSINNGTISTFISSFLEIIKFIFHP